MNVLTVYLVLYGTSTIGWRGHALVLDPDVSATRPPKCQDLFPIEEYNPKCESPICKNRRSMVKTVASTIVATATSVANAEEAQTTTSMFIRPEDAVVTDKVFLKVRISRQDGTFYVRDDLPDLPENRVFSGTLTIGLFGKAAPRHVEKFLSYIK